MNERLRKDLDKAFKVIRKLEEIMRKEKINLSKEKHNEGLFKMMKEIEQAIEDAKNEDIAKQKQ
jgi:hypothetical protein